MNRIKIYTDEDIDIVVSKALKLRGLDASATIDHKRSRTTDEEQLKHATSIGAVLLTHNVQDFPKIHYELLKKGKQHKGIIVAKQVSVGEIVRRILHLGLTLTAEDMENRLEYLSNW